MFANVLSNPKITDRQRGVILDLWGICTRKPLTYKEAAEKFEVTAESIRAIEWRVIQRITRNANNQLMDYSDKL